MKPSLIHLVTLTMILYTSLQISSAETPASSPLNVLKLKEVPEGVYEVQLQLAGKNRTVTLAIRNNRAAFVKSDDSKLDGLRGEFELIGNGVFMAKLAGETHRASQLWLFQADGTATVKEIPDRGERQTARVVKVE